MKTGKSSTQRTRRRRKQPLPDRQLRALIDSAMDAIIAIDEQERIVVFNPAAEAMFGCAADDALGSTLDRFIPEEHRAAHRRHVRRLAQDEEHPLRLRRGPSCVLGLRADGRVFPIDATFSRIDFDGKKLLAAILRDVGERERIQDALDRQRDFSSRLLDIAQAIVVVLDPAGCIVQYNGFMRDLSGYTIDEVRGRSWIETFVPEAHRQRIERCLSESIGGQPTRGNVNPIVLRDGSERIIQWWDSPLHDGDGQMAGLLCIGHDITEQLQTEQRAREAEEMAAFSNLAAGLAHDIGTPLGIILGYAEMLRDSLDDPRQHQRARMICEQVERVSGLVRKLMNLARPPDDERAPVDLTNLLEAVLAFLGNRLLKSGIDVMKELAPVDPIVGSSDRLEQAFLNLLVNAADAMPDGGKLHVWTAQRPDGSAEIRIRDTGVGMPESVLKHIFDPFFTTKPAGHGTGLGLMVTRGIIVDHGGSIDVQSAPGAGTEVTLVLPKTA